MPASFCLVSKYSNIFLFPGRQAGTQASSSSPLLPSVIGLPWQQQDASEDLQDVSPYQGQFGYDLLEQPPPASTASPGTIIQPWFPTLGQCPPFPCSEPTCTPPLAATEAGAKAEGRFGPSPGTTNFVPYSGFAGFLGDPASAVDCGGFEFATSSTFASRNAPRQSVTSLPIGSYSTLVSPLFTAAAPTTADSSSVDLNFASARTNHAHALQQHNSFSPHLETSLDYYRLVRESLAPTQFNSNEQNDSAASSETLPPLIPLSQPPEPIAATTTTFNNVNPVSSHLPQLQTFTNVPRTSQNEIESSRRAESSSEVVHNDDDDHHHHGGGDGSAKEVISEDTLQTPVNMPATSSRKRTRAASYLDEATGPSPSSSKRRTTNTASRQPTNSSRAQNNRVVVSDWPEIPDSDDLFESDPFGPAEEEPDMFDLTKDDIRPGDLLLPTKAKEEDNRVRLAKFECIICMDSASNLTVTHCGMLLAHSVPLRIISSFLRYSLRS